ncbi:uncharacterized protein LOC128206834 isoform X2 [Mya arenaria]|uniref:uncharacterized protein LOC128206834 isoform X2 n=1 Tax=Mya arenaria TaxID=6604 RepID=UPI0022E134BB|nr:uncharacterized protein LOC128206834 isoform X2 [Mya arenaria]
MVLSGYSCLILGLCLTHIALSQKKDTSVAVGVEASKNGGVKGTVDVSKDLGNGVSVNAGGSVDSRGNWGARAGISLRWRRSLKVHKDFQRFNVTLMADPCEFDFYDQDKDSRISKKEMMSIFGNNTAAAMLFHALDRETVDGTITKKEFDNLSAVVINDCFRGSL